MAVLIKRRLRRRKEDDDDGAAAPRRTATMVYVFQRMCWRRSSCMRLPLPCVIRCKLVSKPWRRRLIAHKSLSIAGVSNLPPMTHLLCRRWCDDMPILSPLSKHMKQVDFCTIHVQRIIADRGDSPPPRITPLNFYSLPWQIGNGGDEASSPFSARVTVWSCAGSDPNSLSSTLPTNQPNMDSIAHRLAGWTSYTVLFIPNDCHCMALDSTQQHHTKDYNPHYRNRLLPLPPCLVNLFNWGQPRHGRGHCQEGIGNWS